MDGDAADEQGDGVDPSVLGAGAADLTRLTDAEVIDRLLAAQQLRARADAACVALTGAFDTRMLAAADGARSTAAWVTSRVGVSFGHSKVDLALARDLRGRRHIATAASAGRLTRDQVRALLAARQPGLEAVFDACEALLVDEVAACTLAAGRRFLARWARDVRERFGIPDPDGTPPDGGHGPSRVRLSPVGDRWAGDLDLTGVDGELIATAIGHQIDDLWRTGVFTRDDGLDPAERRAIALVQIIERGTRGGDADGTARPLILGLTTLGTLPPPRPDAPSAQPAGGASEPSSHDTSTTGDGTAADADDPTGGPGDAAPNPPPTAAADPTSGTPPTADPSAGPGHPDPTEPQPPDRERSPDPAPSGATAAPQSPGWSPLDPGIADPVAAALAEIDPMAPFPAVISELSRTGPVHPEVLRRLACEGDIIPVYIGPGADQLNMGRTLRLANRAQRRALRIRDGGCMFPGCSVPPEGCIAHHMVWWDLGGTTDLHNLCLLCRYHHRLVHGGGFTIGRDPTGVITTHRTDGRPLTDPLRQRTPLTPAPPQPTGPELTDDDREHHAAARARITELIRTATTRRTIDATHKARHKPRSPTTPLRC